jgi:hypothetical protein
VIDGDDSGSFSRNLKVRRFLPVERFSKWNLFRILYLAYKNTLTNIVDRADPPRVAVFLSGIIHELCTVMNSEDLTSCSVRCSFWLHWSSGGKSWPNGFGMMIHQKMIDSEDFTTQSISPLLPTNRTGTDA